MKTLTYLVLGVGALAGGCASGGGSSTPGPSTDPAAQSGPASPCGTLYGRPIPCTPYLPVPGQRQFAHRPEIYPFTSWADLASGATLAGNGMSEAVLYKTDPLPPPSYPVGGYREFPDRRIGSVSGPFTSPSEEAFLNFNFDGKPASMQAAGYATPQEGVWFSVGESTNPATLGAIGEPGIAVGQRAVVPGGILTKTPFTTALTSHLAFIGNPLVLGWEYQTFGIWNDHHPHRVAGVGETWVAAASAGAPTPASAVPTTGAAEYSGKLAAFYISPLGVGSSAVADVKVNANFSSRTLEFASTRTMTTRDLVTATPAPNLDIRGTLIYSPASNKFGGTLGNVGGTMSGSARGQYYGPAAQELGGVFTLRSGGLETFTGAYGAKR